MVICDVCSDELFDGDEYVDILNHTICMECINSCKETYYEDEIEQQQQSFDRYLDVKIHDELLERNGLL